MPKRTRNWLIIAYGVFIHVVLIAIVVQPRLVTDQRWRISSLEALDGRAFARELHGYFKVLDAEAAPGKVVLLGDSQFHRMDTSLLDAPSLNFGIGGDTVRHMAVRVQDYGSLERARAIFVWGGVNDLGRRPPKKVAHDMKALLEKIPTHTPVYLLAVASVSTERSDLNNREITELNKLYSDLCIGRCKFIDLHASLSDSTGELASSFDVGDGLHLNAAGYRVVAEQITGALE